MTLRHEYVVDGLPVDQDDVAPVAGA